MKKEVVERYSDITLCNIETDECCEVHCPEATHIRIKTPAVEKMQFCYEEQGFFHADRMLKASISLKRLAVDVDKMIRLEVKKTDECREDILRIALKSFPVDRRFHVAKHCDNSIAEKIITGWVKDIKEVYVCFFKGIPVGFAALEETAENVYEIRLAAVDEKYRMSGAAVSLYAFLVRECKALGGKVLYGWISSVNMPVMNLYISLGASFSEPSDIFLREN